MKWNGRLHGKLWPVARGWPSRAHTQATAFLSARGVKEADLKAWGWAEELRVLPKLMAPLARLRPPGASENLLK